MSYEIEVEPAMPFKYSGLRKLSGLDYIDLRIITALQANARESYLRIGRELGLTDAAVHYRVKKLLRGGVIKRFTIELDPESIGYPIRATFGIEVDPSVIEEIASLLARIPNFYLVWIVSGAHNIHVKAAFRDFEEMRELIYGYLHKLKGVKSYHFSILLKPVKEDYNFTNIICLEAEKKP